MAKTSGNQSISDAIGTIKHQARVLHEKNSASGIVPGVGNRRESHNGINHNQYLRTHFNSKYFISNTSWYITYYSDLGNMLAVLSNSALSGLFRMVYFRCYCCAEISTRSGDIPMGSIVLTIQHPAPDIVPGSGNRSELGEVRLTLRRVCRSPSRVCFVVGDSAPYGVYVPVIEWLGTLATSAGFSSFTFEKTRDRNIKWKNRKHRVPLYEGRLWVEG